MYSFVKHFVLASMVQFKMLACQWPVGGRLELYPNRNIFFLGVERNLIKSFHGIQSEKKRGAAKLRWGGGGAQRLALRVNEPEQTGGRSAKACSAATTH